MALPAMLTYNELNGEEVKHVLENRFQEILKEVPYFQRHITLPRVRMTLNVRLEVWADQPAPETINIGNTLTVVFDEPVLVDAMTLESVDSTAPGGGAPPDEVRARHGLPIPQPARGSRDIGGQVAVADHFSLDGREVEGMGGGLKVSRTGTGQIDGMASSANATIAKIDNGPDGLRAHPGVSTRDRWQFGGGGRERK